MVTLMVLHKCQLCWLIMTGLYKHFITTLKHWAHDELMSSWNVFIFVNYLKWANTHRVQKSFRADSCIGGSVLTIMSDKWPVIKIVIVSHCMYDEQTFSQQCWQEPGVHCCREALPEKIDFLSMEMGQNCCIARRFIHCLLWPGEWDGLKIEFFKKHSLPCAPWCILRLDGAYCAFLVHKYPIYRCSGV